MDKKTENKINNKAKRFPKLKPVMSEKSLSIAEEKNTYVFLTESWVRKPQIKHLIEQVYGVQVRSVRTLNGVSKLQVNRLGLFGGNKFKKCYVRLKEGSKINLTAGV